MFVGGEWCLHLQPRRDLRNLVEDTSSVVLMNRRGPMCGAMSRQNALPNRNDAKGTSLLAPINSSSNSILQFEHQNGFLSVCEGILS